MYRWVKRWDVTGERRLADCPDLIAPEDVGPPTYFISHAWKGTLAKLLDAVETFLASAAEETCVWIDCVAVNQHDDTNPEQVCVSRA